MECINAQRQFTGQKKVTEAALNHIASCKTCKQTVFDEFDRQKKAIDSMVALINRQIPFVHIENWDELQEKGSSALTDEQSQHLAICGKCSSTAYIKSQQMAGAESGERWR